MDRRRMCYWICLATMIVAGCESSPNPASHELVETAPPKTLHVVQKLETPPAEKPQPAVSEVAPASAQKPVEPPAAVAVATSAAPTATTDAARPVDATAVATSTSGLPMGLSKPNKIELLIPNKEFKREGKEKALRVTFDDIDLLKVLNMAPVPLDAPKYFPDWLSGLNGQTIRLRGFMYPPPVQDGLTSFLFMRDNQTCCFGPNAKIYDKLGVRMREDVTTHYMDRPFDVIGKLRIEPEEQDGSLLLLYFIDDAVVVGG